MIGGCLRILLVEDFRPYRTLTISLLRRNSDWHVICEAADGLEAVAEAQQLRPDLILMDIGLPKLNGLEAARCICKFVPSSKIVFLTQETSVELVKEAFSLGAWGYVVKQQAETDLLAALEAIVQGKRFVSSGLADDGFCLNEAPRPDRLREKAS